MKKVSEAERQYEQIKVRGITKKQSVTQNELIQRIMEMGYITEGKVWWFVYELMGFHKIGGEKFYMSYKASTRITEVVKDGLAISRGTVGKLHVYALNSVLKKAK